VVVCKDVRDARARAGRAAHSVHPHLRRGGRRSARPNLCFSSHSPTLRPWIAREIRTSSWRRFGARRSQLHCQSAGKSSRRPNSVNYRVTAREVLSLSGGASIRF